MVNSRTAHGMVVSGTRESGTRGHGRVDSTRRRTGIQKGHPPINGRQNQNKIRIKLDFKTKKPWIFPRLFGIYADLNLSNSDAGFGSPSRTMRTLLYGITSSFKSTVLIPYKLYCTLLSLSILYINASPTQWDINIALLKIYQNLQLRYDSLLNMVYI